MNQPASRQSATRVKPASLALPLLSVLLLFVAGSAIGASPKAPTVTPQPGDLFFSQLLYNPNTCGADPGDGEFVEICNRLAAER